MVSGFVTQKLNTGKSLGEWLRGRREEMNVELDQVAHDLKVPKSYLQGLEEENGDKLPADVYIQGFLKNYAEYLRLNPRKALRLFKKERGIKKNIEKERKPFRRIKVDKKPLFILNPKFLRISLVVAVIVAAVVYLVISIASFTDVPTIALESPGNGSELSETQVNFRGSVDRSDTELSINGQQVFVDEAGNFNAAIDLGEGLNTFTLVAKNRFGKEESQEVTVFRKSDGVEMADIVAPKKLNLEIVVKTATWVSLEADGNNVLSEVLMPEDERLINADESIKISSGNGSATFVKLNGQDMGPLGNEESMTEKEFNSNSPVASGL